MHIEKKERERETGCIVNEVKFQNEVDVPLFVNIIFQRSLLFLRCSILDKVNYQ